MGRQDYQWKHEPCLYGWTDGGPHYFTKERNLPTVIDCDKPKKNELHPTMKPIKLMAQLIENSTKPGAIVLDTFCGSGSTLIACEQLNRICYAMELDPKYCNVIIKRGEDLTGKKQNLCYNINMSNEQNLKVPTSEQAREYGRKGGLASAKKKKERKAFKESLEMLLEMKAPEIAIAQIKKQMPKIKDKDLNCQNAVLIGMVLAAIKGNVKAAEMIRDTIGEKPTEQVNNTNTNLNIDNEEIIKDVIDKLKDL